MSTITSQITSLAIVYSTVYSGTDQRKHQSSASLAFVWGIHRGPVNSPHKWPATRKMFPFDDDIMWCGMSSFLNERHVKLYQSFMCCFSITSVFFCNFHFLYISTKLCSIYLCTEITQVFEDIVLQFKYHDIELVCPEILEPATATVDIIMIYDILCVL